MLRQYRNWWHKGQRWRSTLSWVNETSCGDFESRKWVSRRGIGHDLGMSTCARWTLWPARTRFRCYSTSLACYRKCWWWTSRIHEADRTGDFDELWCFLKKWFPRLSSWLSSFLLRPTRSSARTVEKIYFFEGDEKGRQCHVVDNWIILGGRPVIL